MLERQIQDAGKVDFSFLAFILSKIPEVFWQIETKDLCPSQAKY